MLTSIIHVARVRSNQNIIRLTSSRVTKNSFINISSSLIQHPSFTLSDDTYVEEYGIRALRYTHKLSGADVLSLIAPEDNNKVFSINFRTPVSDSTGVPHIMEHSVLCGSRNYPVKEPFVDLMKGSLQTFLNAFTYPDRTCYPVASMNEKDFYNLINVYLDGVLYPRALKDPMVLKQEGWDYELDDVNNPLNYKGVVFNEMKGVYSSPESLLYKQIQQSLFPNNTYFHDSGGDPLDIPNLTFAQFTEFHRKYYHPANSRVFFYGDDDPVKRLSLLDSYFKDFATSDPKAIQRDSRIFPQAKFDTPMRITQSYPCSQHGEEKHMVGTDVIVLYAFFNYV
jgi:Zn-dependent M16 (insulinase) family peptidase